MTGGAQSLAEHSTLAPTSSEDDTSTAGHSAAAAATGRELAALQTVSRHGSDGVLSTHDSLPRPAPATLLPAALVAALFAETNYNTYRIIRSILYLQYSTNISQKA